ncbi:P-loop containing nucleoside triphosphate hydrolase protein [Periconia macrospinosa]|uniref:P-loop containing nucleoside triphosphate hydrolase protein n=1 Tax=Periconia macrospinosa TaxID=97972 RepID=A0A2V1EAW3_9PLEO|nr:P-loop containing nucleoside triphosphate hydrolase protein [Periconia macrospinosa]
MGPPKENKESGSPSTLILNSENRATSAFGPNTSSHFEPNDSVKVEIDQRDELETLYAHLKLLYDFITEELASIIEFRKKIADGTLKRICFEDLWHLFMPGERIFSLENGNKQLYTVYSITGGLPILRRTLNHERVYMDNLRDRQFEQLLRDESVGIGSWTPLKIDCHYIAFNGEYCGPVEELKRIAPYTGERAVTDLPVFPVQFHPEFSSLIQDMVSRGRKSLFSRGHKSYEGRTLAVKRSDRRIDVQSDVYIDFQAYYNDVPERKPKVGRLLRSRQNDALVEEDIYDDTFVLSGHEIDTMLADKYMTRNRRMLEEIKPTETDLADEYLCLLPCYSLGYIFQLRKWGYLNIDLVEDIDQESAEARAAGFDDLVIPTRYRNLLVALVDSHVSGLQRGIEKKKKAPTQVDIVRGKGQGLIVLLHGPPGAGKTSTAETIAAYTRRPLYSITCGDLGTEPDIVETNLLKHTERADRWGCVLLLDEADVFLARRDWNNMHRNALVSIFLRQLEYYAGILFLTTNRLGGIDEAFKSRVHISLRYPSIDLESTKQMWTNIMKRFEKDNATADVKIIFDKDSLLEFAQRHFEKCQAEGVTWNGRQIRNAFQTALALGHYDRLAKIKEAGLTPDEALASGKKKWRAVKLTKANFQSIAKTTREFEQYIASVRGDDALNAIDDELRRDDYDPDRPKARKSYPAAKVTAAASSKGKKSARKEQVPSEDEDGENFEDGEDSEDLDDDEDDDDDDSD